MTRGRIHQTTPPAVGQVTLTDYTLLTSHTILVANTWEQWGTEELEFEVDGETVEVVGWITGNIRNFIDEANVSLTRLQISLDDGTSWLASNQPEFKVDPMGGGVATQVPISVLFRRAGAVTTKVVIRGQVRQANNIGRVWENGAFMAMVIYTPS